MQIHEVARLFLDVAFKLLHSIHSFAPLFVLHAEQRKDAREHNVLTSV